METILQALKSRTVLFGLAVSTLSVLENFIGFIPASPLVHCAIGIAVGAIIIVLRAVTTQPLGAK